MSGASDHQRMQSLLLCLVHLPQHRDRALLSSLQITHQDRRYVLIFIQQRSSRGIKTDGLMLFNIGIYITPPYYANVLTQSTLLPVHTLRSASELGAVGFDLGTSRVLLQQEVWMPTDCSSGCTTWTCPLLLVCSLRLPQQGPRLSLQRYTPSSASLYYFSLNLRFNLNEL